jgi:zinc D-Ala-D-Ala carboxypeptidase
MGEHGHLGEGFQLSEFVRSSAAARLGLDNTPPMAAVGRLAALVEHVLVPLRRAVGPIRITSGYRAPAVNRAVGGSLTSQHCTGEAVDIKAVNDHHAEELARIVAGLELPVDQCIWYEYDVGGHVHISHIEGRGRRQYLRCYRDANGVKRYEPWSA